MGAGNGVKLDRRYKLPKLKYHGWVDTSTGAVVEDKTDAEVREMVKKGDAGTVKQWIRKQGKGEKGIKEVDPSSSSKKKKNQAKASSKAGIKTPMSSRKVGAKIELEMPSGERVNLLQHVKDTGAKAESSEIPKPNPDGIDVSQLLTIPLLDSPEEGVRR